MPPRRLILDGHQYELAPRLADTAPGSLDALLHNHLLGLAKALKRQLSVLRLTLEDDDYRLVLYWQRKRRPEEKAAGRPAATGRIELRYGPNHEITIRFYSTANLQGWASGNNWHLAPDKAPATLLPDIVQYLLHWNNEEPS